MKMTLRWYGKNDNIPLKYIKQIPNINGIVTSLGHIPVGEVWSKSELKNLKTDVNSHGLNLEVIESVNVHESIKIGTSNRDKYIENYQKTLLNLSTIGVKTVCYNFMPIFDWTRTNLNKVLKDKSSTLSFDYESLAKLTAKELISKIQNQSHKFEMPGWEKSRLAEIEASFAKYENVSEENLWQNLQYFLQNIVPVAESCNIKMAIHPDDPSFSIFGLPRIVKNISDLKKIIDLVPSKSNGITLCAGSLATNIENNIPEIIKQINKNIHFAHIRNIKRVSDKSFYESSHLTSDGSLDMYEIMKALYSIGYKECIRPDHGRMIWDEDGMPGYGLYDRALGMTYLNGLAEAIERNG